MVQIDVIEFTVSIKCLESPRVHQRQPRVEALRDAANYTWMNLSSERMTCLAKIRLAPVYLQR